MQLGLRVYLLSVLSTLDLIEKKNQNLVVPQADYGVASGIGVNRGATFDGVAVWIFFGLEIS